MELTKMMLIFVSVLVTVAGQGYHSQVGIPVAIRIYLSETTASPAAPKKAIDLAHNYLVGVVVTVDKSYSVCGASLLSNTHAITAAHCWWDGWLQAEQFTLVMGSEYIFVGGTRVNSTSVVTHQLWDPSTLVNDLALVMFDYVPYTESVQPIALPVNLLNENFMGYYYQALGYASPMFNRSRYSPFPPRLKRTIVPLQVVPLEQCLKNSQNNYLMESTLCTKGVESVCISHSGGPLVAEYNRQRSLIGVASFGDYSCRFNIVTYAGFVRVTFFLDWIASVIGST